MTVEGDSDFSVAGSIGQGVMDPQRRKVTRHARVFRIERREQPAVPCNPEQAAQRKHARLRAVRPFDQKAQAHWASEHRAVKDVETQPAQTVIDGNMLGDCRARDRRAEALQMQKIDRVLIAGLGRDSIGAQHAGIDRLVPHYACERRWAVGVFGESEAPSERRRRA